MSHLGTYDPRVLQSTQRLDAPVYNLPAPTSRARPILVESKKRDTFRQFPVEVLEEIAAYLRTSDFLSLRLASRTMAPLFSSQCFWKTRFYINGERGFLDFLVGGQNRRRSPQRTDWRQRYFNTKKIYHNGQLRLRRRHWHNNKWLRDRCTMVQAEKRTLHREAQRMVQNLSWEKIEGAFRCDTSHYWGKCKREASGHYIWEQTVLMHDSVHQIAVSFLEEQYSTYITGIEFISKDGKKPNKILGYRAPGNQVIVNIGSPKWLRGFWIASGQGGIHALRVSTDYPWIKQHHLSKWIGCDQVSKPTGKKTRLISEAEILALSGTFDVSCIQGLIFVASLVILD